jgi:hypothetical protein
MIRRCLDTEERRRLCMALALREERAARMAEFRHRLWLVLARPWMTLIIDKYSAVHCRDRK